jgi:hypothetical protein
VSRTRRKYCRDHAAQYGGAGRNLYAFTFNPFLHPEIFSPAVLANITAMGFWRPDNTQGLTRDHKVSVNEAIHNGYDPHYIKHPLNCEIMGWGENNRKKTRSSIDYADLVALVDAYEQAMATRS